MAPKRKCTLIERLSHSTIDIRDFFSFFFPLFLSALLFRLGIANVRVRRFSIDDSTRLSFFFVLLLLQLPLPLRHGNAFHVAPRLSSFSLSLPRVNFATDVVDEAREGYTAWSAESRWLTGWKSLDADARDRFAPSPFVLTVAIGFRAMTVATTLSILADTIQFLEPSFFCDVTKKDTNFFLFFFFLFSFKLSWNVSRCVAWDKHGSIEYLSVR